MALLLPATADARSNQHHAHSTSNAIKRSTPSRQTALGAQASLNPAVRATAVAERFWNAVPCGGEISVLIGRPTFPGAEPGTDGWVTFDSSLGLNDLQAPATTYTQCTISLAHWQWPTQKAIESDWNMFCLTVTHEMGHLLGYPHSLTPHSVMAPVFIDESSVPSICRTSQPPGHRVAAHNSPTNTD